MRMTQDMDDDEKGKLFVGGLSWETSQENLQRYFSRYGEVIDCVVMKNSESGRSRGFGFVTFAEPSLVNVVLQSGPHQLDGRTIDPKPCNPRTLQKPKKGGGYPKVFLGGLPSNVTETDLRMFFARYGKVMEVVIMYDQEKKKSRGFGFLSFEEELSVERVTQEHFINLNGKQVEIKRAEPRDGGGKAGAEGAWGPAGAAPLAHGHNGQLGGPGPPLGVPLGQVQPGLVQGYQGWGASPGQGYGGYGAGGPGYAGWGAPPQPQPQWPAAQYQHGHQHPGQAPQPQSYQTYSQGYANSGYSNSGPAGGSTGGNWNNWNMPQNSTSTGSGKCESPVSEGNYDTWEAPSVQHNPPPSMSSTSQMAMLYGSDPMTQQPQPAYCDEYVDASGGAGDYQRPAKRSHHSTPAVSAAASYHPYRR